MFYRGSVEFEMDGNHTRISTATALVNRPGKTETSVEEKSGKIQNGNSNVYRDRFIMCYKTAEPVLL